MIRLRSIELASSAFLLIVPLEFTAERFTSGWWAVLAYPRLYAAWLLWAASVRAAATENYQDLVGPLIAPDRTAFRTASIDARPRGAMPPHSNRVAAGVQ